MEQLLAHLVGDYILQNDWMATEKHKRLSVALLHGAVYSLPFLLITQSAWAIAVIAGTHGIIDYFALGNRVMWLGNITSPKRFRLSYADFQKKTNNMPPANFFVLRIITDNSLHIIINYYAIRYL